MVGGEGSVMFWGGHRGVLGGLGEDAQEGQVGICLFLWDRVEEELLSLWGGEGLG